MVSNQNNFTQGERAEKAFKPGINRTGISKFLKLFTLFFSITCFAEDVDLIIFSKDRPLQLRALIESLILHAKGIARVAVLYHARDSKFKKAYEALTILFPGVQFVRQNRKNPRKDFMRLLKGILKECDSNYLMFAVDDIVVIRDFDAALCAEKLKSTNAYGFYLRLGSDISYCYPASQNTPPPQLTAVGNDMYSWVLREGRGCWGYPNTVDMTIYPRPFVHKFIYASSASTPSSLETQWGGIGVPKGARGLCCNTSRVVNFPLNIVQKEWNNRQSNRYTVEQLLAFFYLDKRIDVEALIGFPHISPHVGDDIPITSAPFSQGVQ